ncbi:MAG: glycerophosphodiester phosphodiesterase, partial [Sphingomonas sp.]
EIQSFETANLRALRRKLGKPANIRLMQLLAEPATRPADIAATGGMLTYAAMGAPAGLREIAGYADVVAPQIRAVIPVGADNRLGRPTAFVDDAHTAGLLVRIWTFRPENRFLPADLQGPGGPDARHPQGSIEEMRRCIACGIAGFFTDDPALGRVAVDG